MVNRADYKGKIFKMIMQCPKITVLASITTEFCTSFDI